MKNTLVIFAHPYLEYSSSNVELIKFYEKKQHFTFRDLYEEYPDFHIQAFRERKRLAEYERIIFHFPLIWFGVPPLLKLWIDEVFDIKWLSDEERNPMKNKEAFILITAGGKEESFAKDGTYGKTIEEMLTGFLLSLKITGMNVNEVMKVFEADTLTKKDMIHQKQKFLDLLNH
ncbi:MAG: NAD(P)H-dependent oxidoreductase [Kaistella sp.]|nr:NAD(P)H-dependent oxidoreductase [Kaistella sp.]